MYVWGKNFSFPNSAKWNTSICQTSFLVVPLGLLPVDNGVWLYREQVGHFLIISLACCQVIEIFFFKPLLLTWFFFYELLMLLTYFLLIIGQFLHFLVPIDCSTCMRLNMSLIFKNTMESVYFWLPVAVAQIRLILSHPEQIQQFLYTEQLFLHTESQ